jgi:phosphoglycolate phosphatase
VAKTILFDFDGTIANTVDAGVAAFNVLARERGFVEITADNADVLRVKNPRAAMKALSVPLLRVPLVLRTLRAGVRLALPTLQPAEGMRTAILALRENGYRLGIVTSNSQENVNAFLANNQLEVFDFIQAGTGLFNKAAKIGKMITREGLENDELIFIGDEIRDIEAAQKNNMQVVGVTWGLNSREGLESAHPDFIVDTAEELLALF